MLQQDLWGYNYYVWYYYGTMTVIQGIPENPCGMYISHIPSKRNNINTPFQFINPICDLNEIRKMIFDFKS